MPWRWRCLMAMLRCYWSPGFFDSSSQLVCILGSGISHLPLERCSVGFRSGELAGQSSAVIIWSANHLVVVLALWAGGKGNWHLLKACQEMEAWSVVKPPGRRPHWLRPSRLHDTPNHLRLQKVHSGLQTAWILCRISWLCITTLRYSAVQTASLFSSDLVEGAVHKMIFTLFEQKFTQTGN